MISVVGSIPLIVEEAAQIGVIASSARLALPITDGVNHILGQHQLGLIHQQFSEAGVEGTGELYTYAHPDCVALVAIYYIDQADELQATAQIDFTAGTGATVTAEVGTPGVRSTVFYWGAGDTEELVTYDVVDCTLRWITIFGVYRPTLDVPGGDLGVEAQDRAYLAAGNREGHYIIDGSAYTGIEGMARAIRNARIYTIRQALAQTLMGATYDAVPGAGWADPIGVDFRHRARRIYGTGPPETEEYQFWIQTKFDGNPATDTYDVRITAASGDTQTIAGLVNTVLRWDKFNTLALTGSARDTYLVEFSCTDAAATVSYGGMSGYTYI